MKMPTGRGSGLPDEKRIDVSVMQLERAKDILRYIPVYIDAGDYNGAVNRAYYAAFHAIKALEALEGFDSKKHSGVISHFRFGYIKTGILPTELSDIIEQLSIARENSDYNIVISFDAETAEQMHRISEIFVDTIDRFLSSDKED